VEWDENTQQLKPIALLRVQQLPHLPIRYVPVIFITQKAVAKLKPVDAPKLAENIARLLAQISAQHSLNPHEVQLDCDWTNGTRAVYFSLLSALKKTAFFKDKTLSCTIRLHQVKYAMKSGIPPVDRGLIMCYNVGNLKQPGAHNSILDASLTKDYLKNLGSYPLPVDVALPLYSWCLHFHEGRLVGILRDVAPDAVTQNPLFAQRKDNVYACRRDTLWQGYSFRTGDEVRVENPALQNLLEVARFTANAVRNDSLNLLFFHVDSLTLAKYSTHDLEAIYNAYH